MSATPGAEPVASAVPPVVEPEPAATPTEPDDTERLKFKLSEANRHAAEAEKKVKEERRRAEEALQKLQDIEHQRLAGQGEYKQLWEDLKVTHQAALDRIATLEQELEQERQAKHTERLRSTALARVSDAGARKPEQLLRLLDVIEHNGEPAVMVGGVEVPLAQHLATLRQPGSEWEHHFLPTAKKGMGGTTPSAVPGSGGQPNPFAADSYNLTAQLMLAAQNPELAAALKAEAGEG